MLFTHLAWAIVLVFPSLPSGDGETQVRRVVQHSRRLLPALEAVKLKWTLASAVLHGAAPETVECMVGRPATINTLRDGKGPLAVGDFEIDGVKHPHNTMNWLRNS